MSHWNSKVRCPVFVFGFSSDFRCFLEGGCGLLGVVAGTEADFASTEGSFSGSTSVAADGDEDGEGESANSAKSSGKSGASGSSFMSGSVKSFSSVS